MFSIFGGGGSGAPYSSSKGGIVQLSKSLAVAWAKDNIQSNAILPGWFMTELTAAVPANQPERYDLICRRIPTAVGVSRRSCRGPRYFWQVQHQITSPGR